MLYLGASNAASLGNLSSDQYHHIILSIGKPNKHIITENENLYHCISSDFHSLCTKTKECLSSCSELREPSLEDEDSKEYLMASAELALDQGLQTGKLKKVERDTISEYLADGDDVPPFLLNLLPAADRLIVIAASAAGKKASQVDIDEKLATCRNPSTTAADAECDPAGMKASQVDIDEKLATCRNPSTTAADAEGDPAPSHDEAKDGGTDLTNNPPLVMPGGLTRNNVNVKLPYDSIFIFHDAENCPLPKKTMKRNAAGGKVFEDGKVQFLDCHPRGLGDICFADVYAGIIKTSLRCALVGGGADLGYVESILPSVDVNKDLQVTYHFLFSGDAANPFYPTNSVLTGMHTKGVHVLTADRKKGSVDVKITDLMNTELDRTRKYTEEGLAKTLFVLISGDRDFAHTVKRVPQGHIEVVLISSKDCPANRDFVSILRGPVWYANNWLEIVENSQRQSVSNLPANVKLSPQRRPVDASKRIEALSSSPGKISATASTVDDSNLICSIPIESLSKAWFAMKYGIGRLNESVCSLDANLKVEVEIRREVGFKVRILWVPDEVKTDSTCQVSKDAIIAAVKEVLGSVQSHGPIFLPGVSSESLTGKSPEGKELAALQRRFGVSMFVSSQQGFSQASKDDELTVEHPSDWEYHKLWSYCAKEIGVNMDTTHRPVTDEALQKGAKPGFKRSRVRIFAKFTKPSDLEDMKRKCLTHQGPDGLVYFVLKPEEAKAFINKAPKQASSNTSALPSVEGWQISSYNNEAAYVTLTFFKGQESSMKDLLQLISLRSKVVAKYSIEGAAEVFLVKRQFRSLMGQLESCGIASSDVAVDWPVPLNLRGKVELVKDIPPISTAKVTLTGRLECVEMATRMWSTKMSTLRVQKVDIPVKKASQFGLIGELLWNMKKLLSMDRRHKVAASSQGKAQVDEEEEEDEDDDDESSTTGSTVSSGATDAPFSIGLYRSFPVDNGGRVLKPRACVDIAFFLAEDEGEVEYVQSMVNDVVEILSSAVESYGEKTCAFSAIRSGMLKVIPANQKRYFDEFRRMGVSGCYFDHKKFILVLSGNSSAVEDAVKWLTEIPDDYKVVSGHIRAPSKDIGTVLQQSLLGKQMLVNLAQNHCNKPKQVFVRAPVTSAEKQNGTVLVVRAPKTILSSVIEAVKTEMEAWLSGNFVEVPFLQDASRAQMSFLQSQDGAKLLRTIGWRNGVFIKASHGPHDKSASPATKRVQHRNVVVDSFEIATGGGLTCAIVKGNMLRERCAALVNAANEHLMHGAGLAKAIADAAGHVMIEEGNATRISMYPSGAVPVGQCVVTGSHGLKNNLNPIVDHVIHAVGPRCIADGSTLERMRYTETIWSALSCAAKLNAESIAFPLMGSGIYRWPVPLAAELLVEAMLSWVIKHGASCIKRVVLIDNKDECVTAMQSELHKWASKGDVAANAFFPSNQPSVAKETMPIPSNFWSWFKHETRQWIAYDYDQVLQIERAIREGKTEVLLRGDVHGVVSDSKHIPEGEHSAVYRVHRSDLTCPYTKRAYEFYQSNIKSGYQRPVRFESFDPKRHKMFGYEGEKAPDQHADVKSAVEAAACVLSSIQVVCCKESKSDIDESLPESTSEKKQASITAIGPREDIAKAQAATLFALRKARVESNDMDWADTEPTSWQEVLSALGTSLMTAGLEDIEIVQTPDTRVFKLSCIGAIVLARAMHVAMELKTSLLTERLRQETEKLRREGEIAWPEEWDNKDDCDPSQPGCRHVLLQQGSAEWNFVENEWRGSPSINRQPPGPRNVFRKKIARIERLQNPSAWAAYYSRVKRLAGKNPSKGDSESLFAQANEHWMKHGTRSMDPAIIAKGDSGLDYRYCDAGYFGRAAYTADDAQYCDGAYSYSLPDGKAQMFLVRVAAGNIHEYKVRTEAHRSLRTPPDGCDSVRGPVTETNKAIMVYQTEQAYPAYLITYEK